MGMQPGGKRRALIPPAEGYITDGLEPQVSAMRAARRVDVEFQLIGCMP